MSSFIFKSPFRVNHEIIPLVLDETSNLKEGHKFQTRQHFHLIFILFFSEKYLLT